MLVVTRKRGEALRIGPDITVVVVRTGNKVRLGIRAPQGTDIVREELIERDAEEPQREAA